MEGEIVVLTGASGCLGHHTLKLLVSHDNQVEEIRCIDLNEPEELMVKIIDDQQEALKAKTGKKKQIRWIKGDIRDINLVEQSLNGADCVIHCAAKIDIWTHSSEQNVSELESINVGGTENLLKSALRIGVPKFIHVSSFEVFVGYNTIYFATENTLPEAETLLFGASGKTKRLAEIKVRQYSNNKLQKPAKNGQDSLNAIIVRFPTIYGEFDKYFVSKILKATKFLGGKLRRLDHIWIRQQPIYAENAAWALVKAKQCMDKDQTISGEDFHITDETAIGDPFDFVEPYLNCRGMQVTKTTYPFFPLWLLLFSFFVLRSFAKTLDIFGLFSKKRTRLQEAMEQDKNRNELAPPPQATKDGCDESWSDYIMPQTMGYMCHTNFLNRTKASLRLDYDPIVDPEEAKRKSVEWYKRHLKL